MRWNHQLLTILVGMCLLVVLPVATCRADGGTTITVNSNGDTGSGGICVLRDAITAANNSSSVNGCSGTGGGPFTIVFSGLPSNTITLGSTLPTITSGTNLTINGTPGIIIDGNSSVQILRINSNATVSLQYLTLENGILAGASGSSSDADGGAINNQGTLSIANCTLSNNQAIGGSGSVGGFGAGGAIYNLGPLTITDSTLSSNKAIGGAGVGGGELGGAGAGGAIEAPISTVTVTNTTFSGNQATGGTGLSNGLGAGGAIEFDGATLTVTNVTFSGNQAINGGPLGGAINNSGTVKLKGTILAASVPSNCHGSVTDIGYNLADDSTCNFTAMGTSQVTTTANIGLAAGLADNGGPTQTIALLGGGLADAFIPLASCSDQSSPTPQPLTTDQRGFSRPQPSHSTTCSAGAFEYNPAFFNGEVASGSLYYLTFENGTFFGYYSYQFYPYLYHYDLGFEYVVDANDAGNGVYFYDNSLVSWLYTNPSEYPVLYDYTLGHWLEYVAGTSRTFYDFTTAMFLDSPPS